RGFDANTDRRDELILDVMKRLAPGLGQNDNELLEQGRRLLGSPPRSRLLDITEFGRAVHAEMEALLACGRSGTSPRGGTLFSTTFPCHNCAKHIVASGIRRVVYLEPYPKSQAKDLHDDSIELGQHEEPGDETGSKVVFEPFQGVGPRRFFDLFSVGLSSGYETVRKRSGAKERLEWHRSDASLRVPMFPLTYFERELLAAREISSQERGTT